MRFGISRDYINQDSGALMKEQKTGHWTDQKVQKQIHVNIVNWSLTTPRRQYNGAELISSTNSAGITRHPYAKQINIYTDFYPPQNLTQNGS